MTANAASFEQPHWRVLAAGLDTERWFNDGQAVGTGGIVNPQPTRLPSGQYYYRLASSSSPRAAQLGGPWWLDYENFAAVRRFAQENGYGLRDAARLMLALPLAWTRVDLLVRALLRQPLRAYTGLGKPAQEPVAKPVQKPISPFGAASAASVRRDPFEQAAVPVPGSRWIPTQQVAIRQLYVPGLGTAVDGKPLYETVFNQPVEIKHL